MKADDVESMAQGSIKETEERHRGETTPAFDASAKKKASRKKLSKFDGPKKKISNSYLTLQQETL